MCFSGSQSGFIFLVTCEKVNDGRHFSQAGSTGMINHKTSTLVPPEWRQQLSFRPVLNFRNNQTFNVSPAEALKLYGDRLTGYEQSEILDYSEIWFLGLEAKKVAGAQGASPNCGYDDESGSYLKVNNSF